jgi:proteasome accessory factor B
VGDAGAVVRPEEVNLLEFVAGNSRAESSPVATARLWIADRRAAGVRRRARSVGRLTVDGLEGDLAELELYHPEGAADWIAGHGPDVLVLEPDVLAKAVQERLRAIAHEGARP